MKNLQRIWNNQRQIAKSGFMLIAVSLISAIFALTGSIDFIGPAALGAIGLIGVALGNMPSKLVNFWESLSDIAQWGLILAFGGIFPILLSFAGDSDEPYIGPLMMGIGILIAGVDHRVRLLYRRRQNLNRKV